MIAGQDGIIKKATESKNKTEISEEKEGVELAAISSQVEDDTYSMNITKANLENALKKQFGENSKIIVTDNGDGTFTVSFTETKRDYKVSANGKVENGEDWNEIFKTAKAPESQDEDRNKGVIGIGTDGNPVDMDLWEYTLLDNGTFVLNDIEDLSGGSSTWTKGYIGEFNADGTIIGAIPQYISTDGKNFKPVTSMLMTFYDCPKLKVQPKLPTTLEKADYTFWKCSDLSTVSKINSNVTSMVGIYMECTSIREFPELPDSVTYLTSAFAKTNISIAPKIPNGVSIMNNTFGGCKNLVETPYIPDSVINIYQAFKGCTKLEKVTNIPQKTTTLANTFFGCINLKSVPNTIPNTVTDMSSTFQSTALEIAPDIPDSVTNMNSTFRECHNLKSINKISDNAENMAYTFYNCYLLEGELEINANPSSYVYCFGGCSTNSTNNLVLKGNSNILTKLLNTKSSKSKIIIE